MSKKFVVAACLLFHTFFSAAQAVSDNVSWVSGSSVQLATSPSFNFCNGQVTYTIGSTVGFNNVAVSGNPTYTTGMIMPAYIYDPSTSIPFVFTFSQAVCNLRIRFTDLDGGQNEYLSGLSTPYTGLSDVVGHLSGNGTQVNSNMDNARGWVEWSGPITNLTFNYNRPGPGCGLIIDSIMFDCCSSPCQPPNPGTSNTLSICSQGQATDLFPLLGTGATVNGKWTDPAGNIVTMPYNPQTMSPGAYTYTVGTNGCDSSAVITVTEVDPSVSAVTTDVTCYGLSDGSATFTVTNATQYALNGGTLNAIPTPFVLNGLTAGTYQVVVYQAGGCTDTESFTITEPQAVIPVLTPDDSSGCFPHQVLFSNTTSGSGSIVSSTVNFGDGTPAITTNGLDNCSHTYLAPGEYTVSITSVSANGCSYSNTFTNLVSVSGPVADFSISPNPTTIFETHVTLTDNSSSGVVNYQWLIPGGTPDVSAFEHQEVDFPQGIPGNYPVTLVVTDQQGCVDSVTKIVQVLPDVILYAPNTFTPDGNEFNQTWFLYISGIDIYHFNLKVFNRWGEVIWESNDPTGRWDGTYGGKLVPEGEYTWILETRELLSDKKYTFEGHINLIR